MSESKRSDKRLASSPLQDENEKRFCLTSEENVVETDEERTIIDTDFLSSSFLEDHPSVAGRPKSSSHMEELKAALGDPHILEMISKAVAAQVLDPLRKDILGIHSKIEGLRATIEAKDRQILKLEDRVDELEQYGRRSSIRITPVPETKGESTVDIVKQVFKEADIEVTDEMIDRSHRVGKKLSEGDAKSRPILVKCTSYRYKSMLMAAKKKLPAVDVKKLFPNPDWPALPHSSQSSRSRPGGPAAVVPRVYINHDLTRERAEIAWMARNFKRQRKIDDTWVYDGVIFVRQGESTYRVTTKREMRVFGVD
ncbi:hypothetical protein ACOMHN_017938 [Nucella lapillus]